MTVIRPASPQDRASIHALLAQAFGGDSEAGLVDALVRDGDVVLELVAEENGTLAGHILFSRLRVAEPSGTFAAVALAPLAVEPDRQRRGIGRSLVEEAHRQLQADGERLSVVLGDPAYYGRFGYSHPPASGFESPYQCEALQALRWSGDAPQRGRLLYPPAFAALGAE